MQREMQRCLEECDVAGIRRLWHHIAPNMPQPASDNDALVALHMARTQTQSIEFKLRAYSHSWLTERAYKSPLPDELRPKAERMYPRVVDGVGISVKGASAVGRQIAPIIRGAMSDAVMDAYAERRTEPAFVKERMMEARTKAIRKLVG